MKTLIPHYISIDFNTDHTMVDVKIISSDTQTKWYDSYKNRERTSKEYLNTDISFFQNIREFESSTFDTAENIFFNLIKFSMEVSDFIKCIILPWPYDKQLKFNELFNYSSKEYNPLYGFNSAILIRTSNCVAEYYKDTDTRYKFNERCHHARFIDNVYNKIEKCTFSHNDTHSGVSVYEFTVYNVVTKKTVYIMADKIMAPENLLRK